MARYSFSGLIPPEFEHKLRRDKQSFGKIATTVVLDEDENLKRKRRRPRHANIVSKGFAIFIAKDDRPANARDMDPLENIWIIVDGTKYKDPAKTLDELRQ